MRCITLLPGKVREEVDVSRRVTVHGVPSLGDNIGKHKDYECSFHQCVFSTLLGTKEHLLCMIEDKLKCIKNFKSLFEQK